MADLAETAVWEAGVYQIETTDPVIGGAPNPSTGAGMTNIPHQQLAKRTSYLKAEVETLAAALAALEAELALVSGASRPLLAPAFVTTTAEITLSGLQIIDGSSVTAGRRVLVKDQSDATTNGIYVAGTGAWTRAEDFNESSDVMPGSIVLVTAGVTNSDTLWAISAPNQGNPLTLGTTNIFFESVTARMAPSASPAFTGTPTAPTPGVDNDSTRIATTAFVLGQAGGASPLASGAASPGTSTRFSRQDHRHPTDTTRAPLASPEFTGLPLSTTPAVDNDSTRIATTAFVLGQAGGANPLASGTASPGTSTRFSRQDHRHPTDTTRAPLASPEFTGLPLSTTPAVDNDSTRIATTAFVLGQAGGANPLASGTASPGTSTRFSRQDHRHPTDTTRAPLASPVFTGTPTAPLAAQFDDSGQIASTAFVRRALGNYSEALTLSPVDITLVPEDAGKCFIYGDTTPITITLPLFGSTPVGSMFEFINTSTVNVTVQRAGSNQIDAGPSSATSIVIPPNQSLRVVRPSGTTLWHVVGLTSQFLTAPLLSGVAKVWQTVTRAVDTNFQNTNVHPLDVIAKFVSSAAITGFIDIGPSTGAYVERIALSNPSGSTNMTAFFSVPPGWFYRWRRQSAVLTVDVWSERSL